MLPSAVETELANRRLTKWRIDVKLPLCYWFELLKDLNNNLFIWCLKMWEIALLLYFYCKSTQNSNSGEKVNLGFFSNNRLPNWVVWISYDPHSNTCTIHLNAKMKCHKYLNAENSLRTILIHFFYFYRSFSFYEIFDGDAKEHCSEKHFFYQISHFGRILRFPFPRLSDELGFVDPWFSF